MEPINTLFILSVICIWALVLINVVLIVAGYLYYRETKSHQFESLTGKYPIISILVPAHNEEKVIGRTVLSLLELDYPHDKCEIIIINDNSSDNSQIILEDIKKNHPHRQLKLIHTDKITGGKGKSNALNIGFKQSEGEYLVIYDADNTPEPGSLKKLVSTIVHEPKYGAVIGKFRTRNKNVNLLTRFINIETLSFQWMAQAGRWKLFNLATIPGTNFIIRRSIINEIGGWDEKAIAEDTEISFRIYKLGYLIKFLPQAVTWEQEPQTLKVWFKQRVRWAKGNIYVLVKNINMLFTVDKNSQKVKLDILYFLSIYFLLLSSIIFSDILFIISLFVPLPESFESFSVLIWIMAYMLFTMGTFLSVSTERGEQTVKNLGIITLMYFTYIQLWLGVCAYAMYMFIKDTVFKREVKWYKTERF